MNGAPTPVAHIAPAPPARETTQRRLAVTNAALPLSLLAVVVIGSLSSPKFLSYANFINVANAASYVGIIAIGMTFVVVSGALADLSAPAAVVTAMLVLLSADKAMPSLAALFLAILCSTTLGLINALLVAYARANAVIITLAVNIVGLGAAQLSTEGKIVYGDSNVLSRIASSEIAGIPFTLITFAVLATVGHLLLTRSVWGRQTFVMGGNHPAAVASGIDVRKVGGAAFVLTGFLGGIAGALLALSLQTARPDYGNGYAFAAITAVIVGGTSLFGGVGSIPRTVLGLLLVSVVSNVVRLAGAPDTYLGMVLGSLIVVAVGLDGWSRRKSGR